MGPAVSIPRMPRPLVLLHGLGRTRRSLAPVARAARARGRDVVSLGYPWRGDILRDIAPRVGERLATLAREGPLDVVTHSMGGIVLRAAVACGALPAARIHRVVMLAPPNAGSELAERLRGHLPYRLLYGRAGQQLGTGEHSIPRSLPAVPFHCGVIAGRRPLGPLARSVFSGPADGKVSVDGARVEGMADFLVVDRSHTFIMWGPEVLAATFAFLEHGRFTP